MNQRPSLQAFKAEFFRALAHPVRIRILEVLGTGERSVQELQQLLGLEQPVVSQQLAVLRGKNIVRAQKAGTTVRYALVDRLITKLLAVARDVFDRQFADSHALSKELQRERRR
jgi:DNA-binding transcriptional ArsR family regulator